MTRRLRPARRRRAFFIPLALVFLVSSVLILATRAALYPTVDSPTSADAIVVVAGANDDRYAYARSLAEHGVADRILVSHAETEIPEYAQTLKAVCRNESIRSRDGKKIPVECFTPDVNTTEGETTAATRIAHERGYESLLVVTYWGHVSRVRIYFEQCFDGPVYVTDTPRPLAKSRKDALLHETGGYFKAFLKPAC